MASLTPIPIPPAQHWREFRFQVLPGLVFIGLLTAVTMLWREFVTPPTLVGQVEPIQANVTSPHAGYLAKLLVTRFQTVQAGDVVAQVITTDPRTLMSLIQADLDLLRTGIEPGLSEQRNALDYEQLRFNWLNEQVQLATTRVRLQLAERELRRIQELFRSKLVSASEYDLARTTQENLATELAERTKLVAQLGESLNRLQSASGAASNSASPASLQSAVAEQEKKLRRAETQLNPVALKAPIDGMVSMVYRRSGETVMDGEPILTISAHQSDRVVGYLRQPLPLEPKEDMPVEVRTRSLKRQVGLGKVLRVGGQMEPITNALARSLTVIETGLPILVQLPPKLNVRPGELVDLTLRRLAD